ncbi:hypothetical protein EJ04DRAFT_528967 [Polyplosphaeria fusca]|uniref:Uncharacterized protein n=1 Tax=Polyplosphaeria fusca TaxID=682080 RepID=A0A9P4UXB5_9PLEO|nr:hypothetical protein EJ04DRAFT_528967 [Polyplosphaeria fusca]
MALIAVGVSATDAPISLSNFTPRIENLPGRCQTVYTTSIEGCRAEDFQNPTQQRCSSSCVQGLVAIQESVAEACKDVNVPDNSIIGVFLLGQGIPALCPGVTVTTVAPISTSSQPPPRPSDGAQITSSSEEPASSTSTSTSTTSSGIIVDTSVPTDPATTLVTSAATPPVQPAPTNAGSPQEASSSTFSATPSSTASSQKSNSDSGGGSPFDVQATGASSHVHSLTCGTLLGLVALLFMAL